MEKINENFYKLKEEILDRQRKQMKILFAHAKDNTQYLKHLNLDFNPFNYKCKILYNILN